MAEQHGIDLARSIAREVAARTGRDWLDVLGKLYERLSALTAHPLIAGDAECATILATMATARDMPEFNALVDTLGARVAVLLVERGVDAGEAEKLMSGFGTRRAAASRFVTGSEPIPGGGRSRLRL